jgi:type I restriction enzyme M protein
VNTTTHDIVAKLWSLCNILKDDGVTFHQYFIELTYLLFLKMAKETGTEDRLPERYRWDDLEGRSESEQLNFYKELLGYLGKKGSDTVQAIFAEAISLIKKPDTLSELVKEIDKLDWYNARQEGMGDIYEGLIEKTLMKRRLGLVSTLRRVHSLTAWCMLCAQLEKTLFKIQQQERVDS